MQESASDREREQMRAHFRQIIQAGKASTEAADTLRMAQQQAQEAAAAASMRVQSLEAQLKESHIEQCFSLRQLTHAIGLKDPRGECNSAVAGMRTIAFSHISFHIAFYILLILQ